LRALVLEDDKKIAEFVAEGLESAGHAVRTVRSAEEATSIVRLEEFDVLIVDVMLPGMDGVSFIESLRAEGLQTPVLILSALQSIDDKVRGFRSGGDDYLTKPFSFSELLVRLEALTRRAAGSDAGGELQIGDLTLNRLTREVTRSGRQLELKPKEFSLLEFLMRVSPQVVSKAMILEQVWGYDFDPQSGLVDVTIHRLRRVIDEGFDRKLLHTVRGVGYVLKVD
jgi:two-component system OmpR family response regulator